MHCVLNEKDGSLNSHNCAYSDGECICSLEKHYVNYVHGNTILFRSRLLLQQNALVKNGLFCNDTTLTNTLLNCSKLVYIEKPLPLMIYRIGIPSIYSGNGVYEQLINQLIVQENNLKLFSRIRKQIKQKIISILSELEGTEVFELPRSYLLQARANEFRISFAVLLCPKINRLICKLMKMYVKVR